MISCLCVTHDRHEFMPWVEHQFQKQRTFGSTELVIVDSSSVPWPSSVANVVHAPELPGISGKRGLAMECAQGEFISWLDDDDWQNTTKLASVGLMFDDSGRENEISAVGCRSAWMYSTLTGLCTKRVWRYEPIIFNSAVYRKSAVPQTFDKSLLTGEDTEWQERFFATDPNFITLGEPQHAWLCHNKNITNKASSAFFDQESRIPFDSWELEFLKRLHT